MAEYIDLDTPLELYVDRGGFYRQQITTLRELLNTNKIPYTAADVRPVVRATNKSESGFLCSACAFGDFGGFHGYKPNFCPYCGADMRGEDDGL